MRLLVLTPDAGTILASLDPSALSEAIASPSWKGLPLAWTDADAYAGNPAPPLKPSDFVDRQNPVVPGAVAPVTVVAKVDFYRRCTEDEVDEIDAALAQVSSRLRGIFQSVQNFRSDAEEWMLLHDTAVGLFGQDRAAVLLAPSL